MSISLSQLVKHFNITPDPAGATKARTPVCTVSYVTIFEPKPDQSNRMMYSMGCLFDKDKLAELKPVVQAICNAAAKKFGADHESWPKSLKCPLRDGDESDSEGYENRLFINVRNKSKPGLVDRGLNPITDPNAFYSGCKAVVSVSFYGYDVKGKGVGCGLNNIMKWEDGERMDGRASADKEFADLADDSYVGNSSGHSDTSNNGINDTNDINDINDINNINNINNPNNPNNINNINNINNPNHPNNPNNQTNSADGRYMDGQASTEGANDFTDDDDYDAPF